MNLVERLLAVDKGEFDKIETKKLKSKQLSKIVGEDAEVTIQAVDGDLFGGLSASGLDEEGEVDYGRAFSTNAKIAAAGIIEPDLKNEQLLKHLQRLRTLQRKFSREKLTGFPQRLQS